MIDKRSEEGTELHEDSVVERLREEMDSSSDGELESEATDAFLLSLLSHLPEEDRLALQRRSVDDLLSNGESLEPAFRGRLMEGAERGLTHRRNQTYRLQVYLEYLRAEAKLSLDEVAAQTGLSTADVQAVERGERPLIELSPDALSHWITCLKGNVELALAALRQSLGLGRVGFGYAERTRRLSPENQSKAEAFFQAVETTLTSK